MKVEKDHGLIEKKAQESPNGQSINEPKRLYTLNTFVYCRTDDDITSTLLDVIPPCTRFRKQGEGRGESLLSCVHLQNHLLRNLDGVHESVIEPVAELIDARCDLIELDVLLPAVSLHDEHLAGELRMRRSNFSSRFWVGKAARVGRPWGGEGIDIFIRMGYSYGVGIPKSVLSIRRVSKGSS